MKFSTLFVALVMLCTSLSAQRLLSWTPEFPTDAGDITFTIDCAKGNQGLFNYQGGNSADVYVHIGVNTNLSTGPSDWKYVKFTNFNAATPAAKATALGNNKYSFSITNIRAFFGVPAGETIRKLNCIFRSGNGSLKQVNSDGSDMYIPMYTAGQFAVRFNLPPTEPRFFPYLEPINVAVGGSVTTQAVSSVASNIILKLNGNQVASASSATIINSNITIPTNCDQQVIAEANNGTTTVRDTFNFTIPQAQVVAALPAGVIEGINYNPNNTEVTLVLFAPNKNSVSIIGDFNNWQANCASAMKKTPDGNYWWTTVSNLTPGVEYGFQYLVDNSIKIADPYAQKILDPFNDQFINAVTYPNLKPYPAGLTTDLVGVLQTNEPQYVWTTTNYTKPDKKNLMIYELLIRDFTAEHSYQSLIDSINYFKNLGINAIELMPVNEFDGNESWGYNPAFFFAPDKYYGPKNKLKQFIDLCHANGIAVLLDVVYNHCTGAAPQAKLYWNSSTNQPTPNNPWLNVTAPHPYSVFNDFNHTLATTKYLVTRSLNFWLDEYKVDGFRFDLAKGFTQTITNETTVENYDQSRVDILKYYYDNVVPTHDNPYMILEFLGTTPSSEEQAYINHGFMTWANMNSRFGQNTMGFSSNSNLSGLVYNSSERNFSNPGAVGYMESHDEERNMYRNLNFGNANGTYNVKNLPTALSRIEAAASIFFTVPGPKMIWQFGERGYDVSIFFGGSNVSNKPPRWEYMLDPNRLRVYQTFKKLMDLRLQNPAVFNSTSFTYDLNDNGGLFRRFQIQEPGSNGKKVTVIANMDVVALTRTVTFQATGEWTNYISNGVGTGLNGATNSTFTLTGTAQSLTLQPGEYHVYVQAAPCTTVAPTVTTPVNYCQNATASPLTATGTALLWYTTQTGGTGSSTAPTPVTTTIGNTTYYVSQTLNGCEGPRAAIVVNINATPAAPTVTNPVNYCQNATAIPLAATGTSLLWYTTATGGTGSSSAPTPVTTAVSNTTFYVSQTINGCESPRASIVVNVNAIPAAPSVASPVNYCQNATAVALTATGSNLMWYTTATGGTGSSTAPTPATNTTGTTIYYVSQTSNGCESPRASISVIVNAIPAAPAVNSPVSYCQNAVATPLTATGTSLLWYTVATGGSGSATAPTPSTTTVGSVTYYVSQSSNGCESPRASIVVNVTASTPAPTVTSPVNYCQNATAVPLTATGTSLLWYTTATGGTGSSTAPTPATTTVGSTTYYVSQTQNCGESPRVSIVVNVNATPAAPTVTSPVNYCQNATAVALTATGSNLMWYTTSTGGTGSSTAPTPATNTTGTTIYYVSQTSNGCESPRASISVIVNAIPAAPAVISPVSYCQNAVATPLTATGTSLLWYTVATGGSGSATAPTPSTTTVGSVTYYVSQSSNGCESPRASIVVNVTASTPAPTVTSPVNYCQNATAVPLTATGTSLLWYTTATGGTGSATAPTPATTTVGSTTYYVSQTQNCGESPRVSIVVNVNATPAAPTVTSPVNYCQNATAVPLTATGTGLLWYTTSTGGTGSSTAPTPATNTTGTTIYYVSQTSNGCESPRASISVIVNATPAAPAVISPVSYCQNAVATPLTATGTSLLWYTLATGGSGSATAPTPSTTTVGSVTYYVSQSSNGCESPRASIVVNVTASTPAPTVTSPVNYCQNATAVPLTATGTSLLWYTTATGGTGSTTAPTPSTANIGSVSYYVSQTTACGEGPRATIVVTTNATPVAPAVSSPVTYCQNSTAITLTATGANLLWYTAATGGTGSSSAPTPSTTTSGNTTYYVSQTTTGCESPRAAIVVTINALPGAPVVTSPVTYCQNAAASPLTASGSNLIWYTVATGGTGSSTAPTPSTATAGTTTYYVSQTTNTCEGPRAAISVVVNPLAAAPTVISPVNYCRNAIATALTATGNGLLWYTTATGGTGSATAPTPSTATAGTNNYYVSQSNSCGEGPRAMMAVVVVATPAAPTALAVSGITPTTATLNWQGAAGNFYSVDARIAGTSTWTNLASGITATTFNATGLTADNDYEWRVGANCAATPADNYTSGTFKTLAPQTSNLYYRNGIGINLSPNPVLGRAKVTYAVPVSGRVNISVYNSTGQMIRLLYSGNQVAGTFSFDITNQLNNLSSETYFLKVEQLGKTNVITFLKQ